MRLLFLGDIYGKPGREVLKRNLKHLKKEFSIDICIANFENLADGRGISEKCAKTTFSYGVDYATSGNHLWDKAESLPYLKQETRICKPMNYPKPEIGMNFIDTKLGEKNLLIVNLAGQSFMPPANSPFETIEKLLENYSLENYIIFVDFHAEATAEKRAMGWFLDGRVSALVGTHTHIQTADEETLEQGTAYITDVGMTGGHESVIGVQRNVILNAIKDGVHRPFKVSQKGLEINGVVIEIDDSSHLSNKIIRIRRSFDGENS
jgi:metallophosphoesterase (TIGR00282 family)